MIGGWLENIERELHDSDSEHDKHDLSIAHTILTEIINRIEEYGNTKADEPAKHVIDQRADPDSEE